MEHQWVNDIYETCLVALDKFSYQENLSLEDQGIQNLCKAVVYLYSKANIENDRVYH